MFNEFKDPKKHCKYFKYLSIIAFILGLLITGLASYVQSKGNKEGSATLFAYATMCMMSYFQNRLLYTMCKK